MTIITKTFDDWYQTLEDILYKILETHYEEMHTKYWYYAGNALLIAKAIEDEYGHDEITIRVNSEYL